MRAWHGLAAGKDRRAGFGVWMCGHTRLQGVTLGADGRVEMFTALITFKDGGSYQVVAATLILLWQQLMVWQ